MKIRIIFFRPVLRQSLEQKVRQNKLPALDLRVVVALLSEINKSQPRNFVDSGNMSATAWPTH